ncbi:Cuticle-degrading protease [Leucoagaricus sp. SymC.cos]|nr:Cuticle-degrading protease [Leucoagaricus sp. SymC.cos]
MRFSVAIFAAIALLASSSVASAPSTTPLRAVKKYDGETNGKYIVTFKTGSVSRVASVASHKAKLNADALDALLASDEVESVEEDGIMHAFITQTDAPWGLQRISQRAKLSSTDTSALTYTYTYGSNPGAGVDIYVVDTGIYTAHSQFGGRATWGATFGGYADTDGNGHGTHCAGTAAGSQYGVAKSANLVAVKVLSDAGSGAISDIISGLNYILSSANSSGRPSIVSMSLGGSASSSLDSAVASLTSAGVHVVVAAGNSNTDAGSTSPARAPSAITVGASTIADARASFSNYGSVVDVFAPGQNIISSWIGGTTATNNISGTSMATPHVAGLVAYLIDKNGNSSPAQISSLLKSLAVSDASDPDPRTASGTANLLVQNA